MSVTRIPAETAEDLARPVWLRALLTAAFAAFATFWHGNDFFAGLWEGNDLLMARAVIAAFFVLTGSLIWDYAKQKPVPEALRNALGLGAAGWLLAGVVVLFMPTTTAIAVVAGLGFLAMGLGELVGGIRVREEFVPARDHLLLGVVGVLTGAVMALWFGLDIHESVGVAGMGMILAAVLLLIWAAGLTHEVRRAGTSE